MPEYPGEAPDAASLVAHTHAEADVTSLAADLAARALKASNLSDLANSATARTNLGLGSLATASSISNSQVASNAAIDGSKILPSSLTILWTDPASANTNWTSQSTDATSIDGGRLVSTSAQNAEINFAVTLAAGTWTMVYRYRQGSANGIVTVQLDDGAGSFTTINASPFNASAGTVDLYNASSTNNQTQVITGIVIGSSIARTLKLLMATKNASSTNYGGNLQQIILRRTA